VIGEHRIWNPKTYFKTGFSLDFGSNIPSFVLFQVHGLLLYNFMVIAVLSTNEDRVSDISSTTLELLK